MPLVLRHVLPEITKINHVHEFSHLPILSVQEVGFSYSENWNLVIHACYSLIQNANEFIK